MQPALDHARSARSLRHLLVAALAAAAFGTPSGAPAQPLGFGAASNLNPNATSDTGPDASPRVATDGAGTWVVAWESNDALGGPIGGDADILFSRSTNNGGSWSATAPLNSNAAVDGGALDFSPHLATDGAGIWVAVWESTLDLGGAIGTDPDILFARSTDNGVSWSSPAVLNSRASVDAQGDNRSFVAADGAGNWVAVWHGRDDLGGLIGGDEDIFFSRSTDGGATWSAQAALNANAASDSGGDTVCQVAGDGAGNWLAVWRSNDTLGGSVTSGYDIFCASSTDGGATWSSPIALNSEAATSTAQDEEPEVATDGAGNWLVVWASFDDLGGTIGGDADILSARSTDLGATWTPSAALNANAATDSGADLFPSVATDGAGDWLVAWESDDTLGSTLGSDLDILVAHSADQGATWTAPAALGSNAATDSGADFRVELAADGAGHWVGAWHSNENLGGALGLDFDILFTASSAVPVELSGFGLE